MRNIVLTGISRGLGNCLFQELSKLRDVHLFALGRNLPEENQEMKATFVSCDFSHFSNLPMLSNVIPVDGDVIFINNAGSVEPIGEIGAFDMAKLHCAAQVNFVSPMGICNQLVHLCRKNRQRLKVINISTGAAVHPIVGWSAYCSTKAAIKMFLDVLNEQGKLSGDIDVIHFDPGVMDTGLQKRIRSASSDEFPRLTEFLTYKENGKLRAPEDVAREIVQKYIK